MKKLSIIIVTHNSEKDIWECIRSITDNNDLKGEEIEIIVVDNNSDNPDEMFTRIHSSYQNIKTIKNNKNGGYGQGNNIGIRNSSSPLILIMNPDVRLTSRCFQKVTKAFEDDRKLVMYGMKQITGGNMPGKNSFFCNSSVNGYLGSFMTAVCNRIDLYLPSLFCFSGACFFIRKSCFENAGLFDESIFMYGEEDDIHHRLKSLYGAHFKYDKKIQYQHLTDGRKYDAAYEEKVLTSIIKVCQKRGYPTWKVIRNKIQSINILIWRERARRLLRNKYDRELLHDLLLHKQMLKNIMIKGT